VRFSSGSSQSLTVPAANSTISGAGNFTVVVVLRTSTPGNPSSFYYDNTGLLGADVPGVTEDWSFVINGSQLGAGLGAGTNGCSSDFSLYGGNVTDGNAHIAIYERNADNVTLYEDGTIVASQSGLCTDARIDCPFYLGVMPGTSYYYNGDIAEIRIYNRALAPFEITSLDENLSATYGIGGMAGTVVAWGSNSNGQTNVPVNLTNVLAISSGGQSLFNLALSANGTVQGWGNNSSAQTNVPVTLTNVTAIAAGSSFGLAIGSQAPFVNNVTASGFLNHDLAFALSGGDPDGNPLSFYVTSLSAAGVLYQSSNGSRGPAITTPNTLVTDPSAQLIFAPANGGVVSPYASFSFMANDTIYNSATAQVTINVGLPAVPQFGNVLWDSANENFTLDFSGSSNATYSLWSSTNLFNWTDLGTATEAQPGLYQFIDSSVTNSPQCFYRLSAP
jgi:hypothetical protein